MTFNLASQILQQEWELGHPVKIPPKKNKKNQPTTKQKKKQKNNHPQKNNNEGYVSV